MFRYENGDASLKRFINSFVIFLKRKGVYYHYVWVKEQNNSDNVHYHCVFIVDAERFTSSFRYNEKVKELWSSACSDESCIAPFNLVHVANRKLFDDYFDTTILSKDEPYFEDTLDDCIYWLSYLAKVNTKLVNPGRGNRGFGSSLLR
jgi:hypothetical protein